MTVQLHEIAARLERESLLLQPASSDVLVTGITDDSRAVNSGTIFCAWKGSARDSHDFIAGAAQKGAVAAIVERVVADAGIPQLLVSDGRRAAAVAASVVYGSPEARLTITGVTGTNGKTTTAWITRHVLSARYSVALIGTLGIFLPSGKALQAETLTTPGPVELARVLSTLVERGVTAISMEVSSHALDQGRVQALRFDAAIFTNLTRDHLDYHGTVDAYRAAKRSFTNLLRSGGAAVINADDPAWTGLEASAPRAIRFSLDDATADVRAENVDIGSGGTRFVLVTKEGRAQINLPLVGDFNVQNALGAAGAALAIGMSLQEIADALNSMPQVPGRLEKIHDDGYTVLRDYAHTPDALERVLTTLRPVTTGRLIVVFGAGGDRDRGKRPEMGEIAQRLADVAIVTSDNPRTENPESIIEEITTGMRNGEHVRVVNRKEAIGIALDMARPGDVVLLAGKGHETYQIIGTQKIDFDERAIVSDLLGLGAGA
ncbi:MAG TPA: UDP-N-acetylmuramoyl-L-alanyl-D-glutamate--2,6-diaminopimelate ligase [Longimicrobiales bacterium]|nr:UDP-N-acetylmuramoyl-L-alanyl-D-glutamate--2,6-diaminopimelate ligase [Longimicrobiales bacterium]